MESEIFNAAAAVVALAASLGETGTRALRRHFECIEDEIKKEQETASATGQCGGPPVAAAGSDKAVAVAVVADADMACVPPAVPAVAVALERPATSEPAAAAAAAATAAVAAATTAATTTATAAVQTAKALAKDVGMQSTPTVPTATMEDVKDAAAAATSPAGAPSAAGAAGAAAAAAAAATLDACGPKPASQGDRTAGAPPGHCDDDLEEVAAVLSQRQALAAGGGTEFLVRWANRGWEDDTWEPERHLSGAEGALAQHRRQWPTEVHVVCHKLEGGTRVEGLYVAAEHRVRLMPSGEKLTVQEMDRKAGYAGGKWASTIRLMGPGNMLLRDFLDLHELWAPGAKPGGSNGAHNTTTAPAGVKRDRDPPNRELSQLLRSEGMEYQKPFPAAKKARPAAALASKPTAPRPTAATSTAGKKSAHLALQEGGAPKTTKGGQACPVPTSSTEAVMDGRLAVLEALRKRSAASGAEVTKLRAAVLRPALTNAAERRTTHLYDVAALFLKGRVSLAEFATAKEGHLTWLRTAAD